MAGKTTKKDEVVVEEVAATETEEKNEVAVTPETEVAEVTEGESNVPSMFSFDGINFEDYGLTEDELAGLTGLDAIDSTEIRIPYATLIAKASREHEIGDIVFPDGSVIKGYKGEFAEDICVLKIQPVRVYFPTPFSPKNSFICRSLDGKVGAPDGAYAGRPCSECEFSAYPEGGGASPCRDQRLLLCTRGDGSLFHLQVGGVGVKVWKDFMSGQVFHLLPKCKGILGALKIKMGSKAIDTDFGQFPAIDFKIEPKDPFITNQRLIANLNSLKSWKEFEREHLESAAGQAKVQMAVTGENEATVATGENKALF